jgi:hypothetical protein
MFKYSVATLLTVSEEEGGNETLARLTEVLGSPVYPNPEQISVPTMLRQRRIYEVTLAFQPCGVPSVALGPGLRLRQGNINRAQFDKVKAIDDKRPLKHSPGIGRLPHMRSTWIAYSVTCKSQPMWSSWLSEPT